MRRLWTPIDPSVSIRNPLAGALPAATNPGSAKTMSSAWNKNAVVDRADSPGAQPATLHPTRSFALLHAAIYDAVNSIDSRHEPYLVHVEHVSLEDVGARAAIDAAAHEVLVSL